LSSAASIPARLSITLLAQAVWWSLPVNTTGTSAHSPWLKVLPRASACAQ
jgi:hypothetical protein